MSSALGARQAAGAKVGIQQYFGVALRGRSGSVKASLEEIVEFIAEGELTLSAEYGLPRE